MKRLFFALLLMFVGSVAFAIDQNYSLLKLSLSDHSTIAVSLDGRYINQRTMSLTLDGIEPGTHRVTVYRVNWGWPPRRIFTGTLNIEPNTENYGVVDVRRRMLSLKTIHLNNPYQEPAPLPKDDQPAIGNNDQRNDNQGNASDNSGIQPGFGSFPKGRPGVTQSTRELQVLSPSDMNDLQTRVEKLKTDTDKESLMKTVLEKRGVNTTQVRAMLSWFTFESTRLDFAKWAYSHTSDRQNYWKLTDVFEYSSSKDELNKMIYGK